MDTPEGRGTITEVDLLRQRVKVRMEDAPENISVFSNDEIAVFRSGKAKKNDPPIPADWAPISGSGKRIRREENGDEPVRLDPIRFRYSTEAVVEENAEESGEEKARRSRRSKKPRPEGQPQEQQPKKEREPREPKEPKETREPRESAENGENGERKNKNRRPPYRRHRKPGKPGGEG